VHQALERGNDTALCFVLRAVNRILYDEDQPNTTINRLWDVLDQSELNRALRQNSRMILGQKKRPLDDLARPPQALLRVARLMMSVKATAAL
jgi:hypothetical protein